jgi:hypothetical protein
LGTSRVTLAPIPTSAEQTGIRTRVSSSISHCSMRCRSYQRNE